ncbi:MAG: hypothetical protein V4637_07000 [Pseudomonadota bacterium]
MKTEALILATMMIFPAAALTSAHAATAGDAAFSDEAAKQTSIYQSRGKDVPEGYVVDRSLLSYQFILPEAFTDSLATLRPEQRWLDIGAGEGRAVLDYVTSKHEVVLNLRGAPRDSKKSKTVAMSIEDRRTAQWHETAANLQSDQIRYLFGRPLREYSLEELGKYHVITDVLGGFSYTRDISLFMEITLAALEVNGGFYTMLQDVSSNTGGNRPFYPGAPFLTEIKTADGSDMKICAWLKSITCVEVTCEFKNVSSPPIEVYGVRKVCDGVKVPALQPTHFEAGTPPERRFVVKKH